MTDILTYIQENMSSFSKGQKLIANYILQSYDKAAFMTASKLGKTVNVSESTVVRFAAELGFDGYPSMQKTLQEMIRNKLTAIQRVEVSKERIGNQDVMTMVMQSDIEKIRMTLDETDQTSFNQAVAAIANAKRIYILGVRSASVLANFISFYFRPLLPPLLQAHHQSHAVRQGPGGQGGGHHRQQGVPSDQDRRCLPAGQERHGLLRGLPGGSPELGQRPHCGHQPGKGGAPGILFEPVGEHLGRIRRVRKTRTRLTTTSGADRRSAAPFF